MEAEFVSGVDETAVERLKHLLRGEKYAETFSEQCVRMGSAAGKRWVVDAQGQETTSETKNKLFKSDLGCVGHQYDGRLEVATEVSSSGSTSSSNSNNSTGSSSSSSGSDSQQKWSVQRLKRRTTFLNPRCAWQVDLTDVTTTHCDKDRGRQAGSGTEQSTELEFELLPGELQRWLSCSDQKLAEGSEESESSRMTSKLATELLYVFNLCIIQTSQEGGAGTLT
jgi:hypothetical protein